MALMRVLQNGLRLQTKDGQLATGDTICGSMAKHFVVSAKGALSFYEIGSDMAPAPERVALGVMLAKLLGGRARLDDVEARAVDTAAIHGTGAKAYNDKAGETPLPDVNSAHWAVEDVTIRRLADIIIASLEANSTGIFVSKFQLVRALEKAQAEGELSALQLPPQALADIDNAKAHKAYARLLRAEQVEAPSPR